jgi:hypothetical protein
MWRKAWDGFGVDVFAAPTTVRARILGQIRIAAGTPPTRYLIRLGILLPLFHLIGVPFLDAMEVGDGPADGT